MRTFALACPIACAVLIACGAAPTDAVTQKPTGPASTSSAAPEESTMPPADPTCPLPTSPDPDVGQALPKARIDTTYPIATGKTIAVAAGGDLQAALDGANPGDVVTVAAGATYKGPFKLPKKSGDGWIVVRTSTPDANLPTAGTRLRTSDAPALAKVVAPSGTSAFTAAEGAHHFRLVGLDVMPESESATIYQLVELGRGDEKTLDALPHDIVLDRVWVHGFAKSYVKRGIQLNGASLAVIDSLVTDAHAIGQDAQAIGGWNGPGPFKITNNRLEGSGENVLFGGSDPRVPGLVASDIEFTRNHLTKPLSWKTNDPSYAGTHYSVKNIFELKNARRVLVSCNVFENNWLDAQVGFAIVLTPRNSGGTAPWSTVEDVTFTYNVVRHTGSAVNVLGSDDGSPSQRASRILIANNVFDDVDGKRWGGSGHLTQFIGGPDYVKVDHNTAFQSGLIVSADGSPPTTHFFFTNNVTPHNTYGVFGSGSSSGTPSLTAYFPAAVFRRNAIAALPSGVKPTSYPADNFFPASLDAVAFVDRATEDVRLAPTSAFVGKGIDARDLGADVAGLTARITGVAP